MWDGVWAFGLGNDLVCWVREMYYSGGFSLAIIINSSGFVHVQVETVIYERCLTSRHIKYARVE